MISLERTQIEGLIDIPRAARAIEDAYRATARGDVQLPPVGHLTFPDHGADCHIKYGHVAGAPTFVIKVATGFPGNADHGVQTGNGVVLVLSALTGQVEAVLHDEMTLTDIRTGVGGAIASRRLARAGSTRILVLGTGPQAKQQVLAHAALLGPSLTFSIWGRTPDRVAQLVDDLSPHHDIEAVTDLKDATRQADIIVTATGATAPLIRADWVQPGTHITAVGADAPGKQELDIALVAGADVLAVDLAAQCIDHGEVSHAIAAGRVTADRLHSIGALLETPDAGRTDDTQITIADLTGIAAQDIAIANAVLDTWRARQS